MNNNRSVNFSCRMNHEIYNSLIRDAELKGISINSLVNSVIKKHLFWDRFAEEIGLVPLTKDTLKKIFDTMADEDIKTIAKEVGGTVPQELIYLSYEKFDFHNLMKMIEISDKRFGRVTYKIDNSIHSINILHGINKNFSNFLAETHQSLANNLSLRFVVEHPDNNMISMEFEKPNDSTL